MKLKRTGSLWNRDNRNGINSNWERLETVFKNVDKLVIEGKLTPDEYAEIITSLNGLLKSGNVDKSDLTQELRSEVDKIKNKIDKGAVSVSDIDKNKGKLDQTYLSDQLLQQMAGDTPINAVPADGSVNNSKLDSIVYGKILDIGTNANSLDVPGFYTVSSGVHATEALNFPPGNNFGVLNVRHLGEATIAQSYTMHSVGEIWTRRRYSGSWSAWRKINENIRTRLLNKLDLNEMTDTGEWRQVDSAHITSNLNYPDISGDALTGTLLVSNASGSISQVYIADRAGEIFVRDRNVAGRWYEWKKVGGTNESGIGDGNSVPKTDMEITGRWTSNDAGDNFMFEMGKHELVEIIEVGRSVRDRPIYAAVIGDPTKPAYYINAASHGTEVGAAEAAWLLVREFTQDKSLMFMDMCIIILPNQNPDNRFIARGNKNAVDINRDWVDQEQPETHAAMHILNNYNVVAATDLHNFGYPRHVSLKEAIYGTPEVMAKSQELFDLVTTTLENDDQLVRRYDPEAPNSSFTNGVAEQWNVATLLIEIPCGGFNDWTFDHYYPTPYWQAYVGGLACKSIARHVWKNLDTFVALKSES